MAQGKKSKGGKKRKITPQLIEKASKKSKQLPTYLKVVEEEEQVVEEIHSDCEEDDEELSTPGVTPILPEENNFDQMDEIDEEIMQTTDTTQESILLDYYKDIEIKPDSNGRVYFEVEIGEQSSENENDQASDGNENAFEIGLYKGGNFLGITNSGVFNVDGKKVDMEIGEIKQGDVVGVFYSFGSVYFTHNGKKIAHPFEWNDVNNCLGIVFYRYEHQKFSFNTTGNFLFPGYKGTNEDYKGTNEVQCRFSEIRQKLNQIEQSYLKIEKDNRELKEAPQSSGADRLALTEGELSTLSTQDIYDMQDVLHKSLGLINEEIRKRNKL